MLVNSNPVKRRRDFYFPILLSLNDLACLSMALLAAYFLRFQLLPRIEWVQPFLTRGHLPSDYLRLFPIVLIIMMVSFGFVHLYRMHDKVWSWNVAGRLLRALLLGYALFFTTLFFFRQLTEHDPARGLIPLSMTFIVLFVGWTRHSIQRSLIHQARKSGKGLARALVLGVGKTAREVARTLRRHPEFGWTAVGFISAKHSQVGREQAGLKVLDTLENLAAVLEREKIEAVFVAQPDFRHEALGSVVVECQKRMVDVKVIPDITEMLFSQVGIEEVDGLPILGLRSTPLRGWNVIAKRLFDLCLAGFVLLPALPFMAIIALLVKIDSRGPVFYHQERVGADGRRFFLTKFRTMKKDAEKYSGPVFSGPNDPRQTRVGRLLRQTHLDELPQLFNVLKGQMSVVGPRPERPFFVERFREEIPRYMARHRIKSGLTGWAQVSGQTGHEGSISERLKYDLFYIENWSLLFDIKIILLTFVWLFRRIRQLATLPADHPSLRRSHDSIPLPPEEEQEDDETEDAADSQEKIGA